MQTAEINSIDTTLRELAPLVTDVQRTLEAGLDEGGSGAESVAAVVQPLATIRGTLELLDLHGASILVREMGEIATAVSGGHTEESEQALETLLEAVLRLPDYLDRIRAGHRDAPALLLPLVNRLRALRGVDALEDDALFFPSLPPIGPAADPADDARLQNAAQRVRSGFQRALLGWYRGAPDGDPLAELVAALQQLAQESTQRGVQQLWEIGAAFAESLADDDADGDGRVKALLARIERLIAEAARGGESALAHATPSELMRALLYQLARTHSERATVRNVRQAYQLEQALPSSGQEAEFGGLNRELLDAVGEGIRTELAQIKDAVEIYVHGEERRTEVLDGLPERLKHIADTFSMLGLTEGHATLHGEARVLAEIEGLESEEADQRLQTLADELLRAEGELARLERGQGSLEAAEGTDGHEVLAIRDLPDSEYQPLVAAVVGASLENLSKMREAFGVYCSQPEPDPETVSEVPALLAEVEGAAWLLPLESIAPLLAGLREYTERELANAGRQPDDNAQILIADVVAGLEYYLEAVAHDRIGMTHLLEGAVRALDALRSGGTPEIYDEDEQVVIEAPADEPASEGGASDWVGDIVPAGPSELGEDLESNAETFEFDEDLTEFGSDTFEISSTGDDTPAASAQEAEGPSEFGGLELPTEPEAASIPAEADAASELAHTASESGPDLTFDDLAAFAERPASDATDIGVAADAPDPAADVSVAASSERATPAEPAREAAASGPYYAIVGDDVDEDVVEVYIEEALGELDKINEHLPRWKANPADEEAVVVIRRAYHTLKGGGRLIGAELLGEFSWSMETLLNRVIDGSVHPSPAVYETLDEASAALPQLVEQIQGNRAPIDGIDDLIARGHALSRGETPPAPANPITAPGGADSRPAQPAPAESAGEAAPAESPTAVAPDAEAEFEQADVESSAWDVDPMGADSAEAAVASADSESHSESVHADFPDLELDDLDETLASGGDEPADGSTAASTGGGAPQSATAAPAPPPESAAESVDTGASTAGDGGAHEQGEEGGPDSVLLDIFSREAASHQEALRRVFAGVDPVEMEIDPEFSRPIHTLVGSSQTAGVDAIAELSGALEDIVRARREQRGMLEPDDVGLFAEAVAAIDRVLEDLPRLGRVDTSDVRERLEAQRVVALAASQSAEDQSDNELLEVFLSEGDELLEQCDRAVAVWREQPEERAPINDLQRGLHTLKGGARMANLTPIADLTHELESLINGVDAHGTVPNESVFELLQETVDALTILMEQARALQPIARVDWLIDDLREVHDQATDDAAQAAESAVHADTQPSAPAADPESRSAAAPETGATEFGAPSTDERSAANYAHPPQGATPEPDGSAVPAGRETSTGVPAEQSSGETETGETAAPGQDDAGAGGGSSVSHSSGEQVRVQAGVLDNLVNFAGEVSIYHSRLNEQMGQYRFNLSEFDQTVSRLRTQLRTMEDETESQILYRNQTRLGAGNGTEGDKVEDFDPLEFDRYTRLQELSRSLSESIGDLDSLKEIMETITRDAETLLLQQSRVSSELQDGLMQTRMVRFDGLRGRLARIVRQTAGQLGKKAQLTLTGGEIELDRSVQERIVAPLEHVLRNAVAHGIEAPDERERRGKPGQGAIQLDLHRGGTDIVIEIIDDGRGIDPEAVRRRAIERGLLDPNDDRDDGEVIRLVLETGFSTADAVTQISGRGVGMDVVESEIRRLGGTLGINTEVGRGTRFTVRLPVTLAINQAVLVETGDDVYAIPIASVEGVAQVSAGDLKPLYVDRSKPFLYANSEYRLEHLGRLLGTSEPRLDNPGLISPVILTRAGDERIALHVERLVGRRDIVVKPIGAPVNELAGLSGATIMPDGRVILILDIGGLLRTEGRFVATGGQSESPVAPLEAESAQTESTGTTVLVVDDSITIRKVTQRVLERNGYNVVTAKDGIDALAWMAHSVPDIMLLDIEMPRMDGYEVATYVRGEERLTEVPIIMITSRTGDKHRGRAEEIGVNCYLGKPYQETELMENIEQLLHSATAV